MQFFRAFGGGLLWIVASLVGLVAGILCVTVILLPLGTVSYTHLTLPTN